MSVKNAYERILVVDDEAAARKNIIRALSGLLVCPHIKEAVDGEQALRLIAEWRPELVFLDIQLPVKNGLSVARLTQDIPYQLIFVTAYDEYAVQAFTTHAVGFICKPICREQVATSLKQLVDLPYRLSNQQLKQLSQSINPQAEQASLVLSCGEETKIICPEQILFIESTCGYCKVVLNPQGIQLHGTDSIYSDMALTQIHNKLLAAGFLRVHRNFVVNTQAVLGYFSKLGRNYIRIKPAGETLIPVSRRNVKSVKQHWVKPKSVTDVCRLISKIKEG
ncbi:LytR/AlgR family response regulator transcription factor [Thalassomonas haliotis]|uniref:Response regulator transcription factor n=1 Tax=Thalassomonas haliotis TaxID=485448 RepID=A0ABY7VH66_9GAMM|nr:LytTR family DNA-binding domain-containing protein [Thalassomonas haliotis]WDE12012.1 response regulator transcription factor [Thalassomonas haliotis]